MGEKFIVPEQKITEKSDVCWVWGAGGGLMRTLWKLQI